MDKTEQLKALWEDQFGIDYTLRKRKVHESEGSLRENFWRECLSNLPGVSSILEVGCNLGMNLDAINKFNPSIKLDGIEPNDYARKQAIELSKSRYTIHSGSVFNLSHLPNYDLIFTCTVLIHIHPNDLIRSMEEIYKKTNTYIMAMEYYWPVLKNIYYRGEESALWAQDYGALWLNNFELQIESTGYLSPEEGFDRVTWWLLKK